MEEDKEETTQSSIDKLSKQIHSILKVIIILAILAGLAVLLLYFLNFSGGLSERQENWGAFGDFIGGSLNPFFSFLALIAILLTIIVQSRELNLSTIELSRSAAALKEQSKTLTVQNFENTFFQMVRLHNDIVNGIDLRAKGGNITTQGRDCFEVFYEKRFSKEYGKKNTELSGAPFLEIAQSAYQEIFNKNQGEVGHYFRNLYTIIRYIDDSVVNEKKKYIRIIRAQLSSYEIALLFYNSLHSVGRERFKPLIERYELLENMDLGMLKNPPDHIPLYNYKAYGDQDLSKYIGGSSTQTV